MCSSLHGPALAAAGGFLRRIAGLRAQESVDLVLLLKAHVTKREYTVRWRWRLGDVAIMDNRATQRYAIDDRRRSGIQRGVMVASRF